MNIGDGFQNLQQIFGNRTIEPAAQKTASTATTGNTGFEGDQAHVSSAASLATQAAGVSDVRMEKVTAIQQTLAAGTYSVSNTDVAASLINHMLQR